MADQSVDIPGVGVVAFPDSMTEAQINAASTKLYQDANPGKKQPPVSSWAGAALPLAGAGAAVPIGARMAEEAATNPAVPRTMAAIGRGVGAVEGALKGGPLAIGPGAWAGGKGGWFSGKVLQSAAAPVSNVLEKAAPYAQMLSTASGAQGALDLAQMAEPNRKDIGFLGVGAGDPGDPAHPALLNMLLGKAREGVAKLVDKGMSTEDALAAWLKGKR